MALMRNEVKSVSGKASLEFRLGELLVKEGIINEGQLDKALGAQNEEAKEANLPFGQLMIKKGLIDETQLEVLLGHPDLRKSIGAMIQDKGLISVEQLETSLRQKKPGEQLGHVLVRDNLINKKQLEEFLREQAEGIKLGELACNLNMITEENLDRIVGIKSGHRTLGEILCDIGLISPNELNYILRKYDKQIKLGEILLKQGVIDEYQFQAALEAQRHSKKKLGKILVEKKLISTEQLYNALSRQFNISFRTLSDFEIDTGQQQMMIGIIGRKYASRHKLLPLLLSDKKLTLALSDPEGLAAVADLQPMYPELELETVLITEEKFEELFCTLYSVSAGGQTGKEVARKQNIELVELTLQEDKNKSGHANIYGGTDMMAEQVVNHIISYGITNGASDIHIEQDRQETRLRYRLDGVCKDLKIEWLNKKIQEMSGAIISRIKVLSNLDIAERRLPQDGVFRVNYYDKASDRQFDLDFRVATCPAIVGENVTIRILDSRKAKVGLENLNHSGHVLEPLKRLLKSAAGMILVSGPTGSGKSSTLYAALRHIYNPGIKIITAEDPIEYSFPGIMQTQIKPKIGLTFARLLRSFLRLDPDVILVGEIRDDETASIGFDAAQTGHLLLSTIHTNDAISAVSRLLDLNVEHNQMASSLIGVLAQRLVRRICGKCIRPHEPPKKEWELFFKEKPDHLKFYKGVGCKACGYTGYKGRTLISELFEIDRDIALALSHGATENEIKRMALNGDMKTMIDDGLMKLDQITLSELIRVVPIEMIKEFASRQTIDGSSSIDRDTETVTMAPIMSQKVTLKMRNPQAQYEFIDQLYQHYCRLREAVGQPKPTKDRHTFRDFIVVSVDRIKKAHSCSEVAVHLKAIDGRVDLYATPM